MPERTDNLALVTQFMSAMGQPVGQGFEDAPGINLGIALIEEEFIELTDAAHSASKNPQAKKENFAKELADLLYVTYWLAARIGIDIDKAFHEVHKSNMSKLGDDGKPVKRADGKVLKGPNYKAPDLSHIVNSVPVTLA